jgi:hypothetical protein
MLMRLKKERSKERSVRKEESASMDPHENCCAGYRRADIANQGNRELYGDLTEYSPLHLRKSVVTE